MDFTTQLALTTASDWRAVTLMPEVTANTVTLEANRGPQVAWVSLRALRYMLGCGPLT